MIQLDPKKPVSLEDLLHLKRAEQPPEAFWLQFESELRAKQLAAIVDRSPWWSSWRQVSRLLARQSLPIGATAVLALGLLSYQGYRAHASTSVVVVPVASVAPSVSSNPAELNASIGASMDSVQDEPAETTVADSAAPAPASAATASPSAVDAVAPAQTRTAVAAASVAIADPFSALMGSPNHPAQPVAPQSDAWNRFGDQQLAANSLASTVGFAPRAFSTPISEPLAQMATPLDERRAMLLSGSLPHAENAGEDSSALNSDDHSASHLSDDRLYESVRRLGVGGNRLSIRF